MKKVLENMIVTMLALLFFGALVVLGVIFPFFGMCALFAAIIGTIIKIHKW